jgi:Na+-translocating ferredoxin:NAD+ oxidoreductase RNF subunit RnfB
MLSAHASNNNNFFHIWRKTCLLVLLRDMYCWCSIYCLQVYPVAAVVGAASGLFTYMIARTIVFDPDTK